MGGFLLHGFDHQAEAINVTVAQQTLPLSRHANKVAVTQDMVESQKSLLAAINLCVSLSGLEDKEIAAALEIQPAQWSRIQHGEAHFPPNKLNDLMDLCGNEAPLLWIASSRGYALVLLKSEAERRADAAEERARKAEERAEMLRELLMERGR